MAFSVFPAAVGRRRQLQSVIGFSKILLKEEEFAPRDERVMRKFLRAKKVKDGDIEQLLQTTPALAKKIARGHLSEAQRQEIARYIFPLVYTGDGVISSAGRRRFARVCDELGLEAGTSSVLSKDYRTRLDAQWSYLRTLIERLNHFAHELMFDSREMELLRQQLELLMSFDPRRVAAGKRSKTLQRLGHRARQPTDDIRDDSVDEAALMSAYAMAHTAVRDVTHRKQLARVFDLLVRQQLSLSPDFTHKLLETRRKIDRYVRDHAGDPRTNSTTPGAASQHVGPVGKPALELRPSSFGRYQGVGSMRTGGSSASVGCEE